MATDNTNFYLLADANTYTMVDANTYDMSNSELPPDWLESQVGVFIGGYHPKSVARSTRERVVKRSGGRGSIGRSGGNSTIGNR